MKSQLGILLALTLVWSTIGATAFAETPESCQEKFEQWIQKYASSSPILAKNKLNGSPDRREDYKSAFQNPIALDLAAQRHKDLLEYVNLVREPGRDLKMIRLLDQIIEQSISSELIIVLVGAMHLMDFYFDLEYQNRKAKPLYARTPYDRDKIGSPEFQSLLARYGATDGAFKSSFLGLPIRISLLSASVETLKENYDNSWKTRDFERFVGNIQSRNLGDSLDSILQGLFTENLIDRQNRLILVGEPHDWDGSQIFKELPSSQCLPLMGYTRLKIVYEGIKFDTPIESHQLNAYLRNDVYHNLMKFFSSLEEVGARLVCGKFLEDLAKDRITLSPNPLALSDYALTVEESGIPVQYFGIDTENVLYGDLKLEKHTVGSVFRRNLPDVVENAALIYTCYLGYCIWTQQY